jgi:hypothetical protein
MAIGRSQPRRVDEEFVAWLLANYVLWKDLGKHVAPALANMLVRQGILVREQGNLELARAPGALRRLPQEAAASLKDEIERRMGSGCRASELVYAITEWWPPPAGAPCEPSSYEPWLRSWTESHLREWAEKVEWFAPAYVDLFGPSHREEGIDVVARSFSFLVKAKVVIGEEGDDEQSSSVEGGTDASDFATLKKEGGVWFGGWSGQATPLKELLGFKYLRRLIQQKGHPVGVVELESGQEASSGEDQSSQDVIDDRAETETKTALEEVILQLAEPQIAAELREELEKKKAQLEEYLREASGLGKRRRQMRDEREAVKGRVKAAIRAALEHLQEVVPSLGDHLRKSIETPGGVSPCYRPKNDVLFDLGE